MARSPANLLSPDEQVAPSDASAPRMPSRASTTSQRMVAGKTNVVPSTRAVLGALLCAVAALLVFAAFQQASRPPKTRYAVAARELVPGQTLRDADIEYVAIDLPAAQRNQAIESTSELKNIMIVAPLSKGELLQRGSLVRRLSSDPLYSFPVPSAFAVGGRVRSGSRISLFGTTPGGAMELVAKSVLVVRVDRTGSGSLVVTIAIPRGLDTSKLVAVTSQGKLAIVDETTGDPGVAIDDDTRAESKTNSDQTNSDANSSDATTVDATLATEESGA